MLLFQLQSEDLASDSIPPLPRYIARQVTLRKKGNHWSLTHSGITLRLPPIQGVAYLARLLASPGSDLHVLSLVTGWAGDSVPPDLAIHDSGDLRPIPDDTAKAAYRRRLVELWEDIAEAEEFQDDARASRARSELEAVTSELARAVGLGGWRRPNASTAESARVDVTRGLRSTIAMISEAFPELGHHLNATVITGMFCAYRPGPVPAFTWRL